jgi:hypothetical protein
MLKATAFYDQNKSILESDDCKEAHEWANAYSMTSTEYVDKCTNLIKASSLSRDNLITILSANDRNGIYSDERSIAEEMPIATKADLLLSVVMCELEL